MLQNWGAKLKRGVSFLKTKLSWCCEKWCPLRQRSEEFSDDQAKPRAKDGEENQARTVPHQTHISQARMHETHPEACSEQGAAMEEATKRRLEELERQLTDLREELRDERRTSEALKKEQAARIKTLEYCVKLMDEMDTVCDGHYHPELSLVDFAGQVLSRLEEVLEGGGLERIENDSFFDLRRHKPYNGGEVRPGSRITETVRPGFILETRVFRRAAVRVDNV